MFPSAPAGAPCAYAGEIRTIVSNGSFSGRGSIPSGARRSFVFPRFPALLAKCFGVIGEFTLGDGVAQLPHQRLVVMQVVQGVEPRAENLVDLLQVMQVAAREMRARVAPAALIERVRIVAIAGVADLDVAAAGEEPAIAGVARRQHAVEHVDSGRDRLDDILGRADAHEIARLVGGEPRRGVGEDPALVALGLAHREPADRVAVETDARQTREGFVAQALDHAALDDAEEGVRVAFVRALRALGPAQAQAHRLLRREQQPVAVHGRSEAHAFLRDLAKLAQAEYLIASGVSENRSTPAD